MSNNLNGTFCLYPDTPDLSASVFGVDGATGRSLQVLIWELSTMAFTLVNARPSPFGRKVAIVLIEKGLPYEVDYDLPWGEGTRTPEFSPLEQLPILVTEAGEHIYDSAYIVDWLEQRYPQPALLPEQLEQRLEAMQRRLLGERLMEIAQNLIFEMHRPEPSAPWVARQTRKVNGGLAALERHYSTRVQNDLNGFDLGDIAVGTSLLLFEFAVSAGLTMPIDVLVWRGRYPAITKFLEVLEQRPSFVATRPETMVVDIGSTIS